MAERAEYLTAAEFREVMLVLEGIDHRLEQIERRLDEADRRELEDEARRNTEFLVRNRVEREAFIERVERFGTRTSAGRD